MHGSLSAILTYPFPFGNAAMGRSHGFPSPFAERKEEVHDPMKRSFLCFQRKYRIKERIKESRVTADEIVPAFARKLSIGRAEVLT